VRYLFLSILLLGAASGAGDMAHEPSGSPDIDASVSLDAAEQNGEARGTVRILAARETVWSLIASCPEALHILPGLQSCEVLETARDHSWQRIRHVMNYSWYMPTLTYELRADYQAPTQIHVERLSGDLRSLSGSWTLEREGAVTVARYTVSLSPGFWVPHWVVRAALRRDLPTMLRALKSRAESIAAQSGGPSAPGGR
jgi:hypothetical protein